MSGMTELLRDRLIKERDSISNVVLIEMIRLQRRVIETAANESPEAAIDMLAEYYEEAGVEDADTLKLLDAWWKTRPFYSRVREQEQRENE